MISSYEIIRDWVNAHFDKVEVNSFLDGDGCIGWQISIDFDNFIAVIYEDRVELGLEDEDRSPVLFLTDPQFFEKLGAYIKDMIEINKMRDNSSTI